MTARGPRSLRRTGWPELTPGVSAWPVQRPAAAQRSQPVRPIGTWRRSTTSPATRREAEAGELGQKASARTRGSCGERGGGAVGVGWVMVERIGVDICRGIFVICHVHWFACKVLQIRSLRDGGSTCTRGHACVFSPLHHRTRVGVRVCACIDRCMHACATLQATHPLPYRPFLEIKPSDSTLTNCAAALAVCMRSFLALSCMQLPNTI
jgi:hypothetical protein